jgi:alpha-glucoside transport system permease protein
MNSLLTGAPVLILIGAVAIPAITFLLLGVGDRIATASGRTASKRLRPWIWLLAPLGLTALVLVYPMVETFVSAFQDASGNRWVGLSNFAWAFTGDMLGVLGNNAIWLIVFPVVTVGLALIAAALFDRVRYEKLAMTIIVLPTAISFTAGAVIWRQVYQYNDSGEQLGLLNAIWTLIPGAKPVPWLQVPYLNTFALIFVAVWASLGVAALILSAAVKGVPAELLEAARLDGAGEIRVFLSLVLSEILPTVLVVLTTEVIFALKIFDIVYVMTNGNFSTDVIANRMYLELFGQQNLGHAAAIAVILLLAALPVVFINIRQFSSEEAR